MMGEIVNRSHRPYLRKGRKQKEDPISCVTCAKETKWTAIQPNFKGNCWDCTIDLVKNRIPVYIGVPIDIDVDDSQDAED